MSQEHPVDVMLFMPQETFNELHGHANRLGVTDAALFTACWLSARPRIEAAPPRTPGKRPLTAGPSGAVYVSLEATVRDDALAFAEAHDCSMSLAFLRAWDLVHVEVAALANAQQLAAWQPG